MASRTKEKASSSRSSSYPPANFFLIFAIEIHTRDAVHRTKSAAVIGVM